MINFFKHLLKCNCFLCKAEVKQIEKKLRHIKDTKKRIVITLNRTRSYKKSTGELEKRHINYICTTDKTEEGIKYNLSENIPNYTTGDIVTVINEKGDRNEGKIT